MVPLFKSFFWKWRQQCSFNVSTPFNNIGLHFFSEWTGLEFQQFECFLLSWVPLFFKVWPQTDGYDYQLQVDYISAWSLAVAAFRTLDLWLFRFWGFPLRWLDRWRDVSDSPGEVLDSSACKNKKVSLEFKATDGKRGTEWDLGGSDEVYGPVWQVVREIQIQTTTAVAQKTTVVHMIVSKKTDPLWPQQQDGPITTQFNTNLNHNHKHSQNLNHTHNSPESLTAYNLKRYTRT